MADIDAVNNSDYLLRSSHISKEISRHSRVRLRIQHKRVESQISQPTFLSPVSPFSSALLQPMFWVCRLAWWPLRHSPFPLRPVRPRLWSRWWPWSLCVPDRPDQWRRERLITGPDRLRVFTGSVTAAERRWVTGAPGSTQSGKEKKMV